MNEISVYIANLGKYNESELVGAWFSPPIDFEDVKEKIGLNNEYEEYAIHDYESPIPISEYTSIDEINRLGELLEEIETKEVRENVSDIIGMWFSDLEELVENQDSIVFYSGCDSMEDIAYTYVEEGLFGDVPENLQMYLNYSAIGRDLEINGNFLVGNHGIFEYAR